MYILYNMHECVSSCSSVDQARYSPAAGILLFKDICSTCGLKEADGDRETARLPTPPMGTYLRTYARHAGSNR